MTNPAPGWLKHPQHVVKLAPFLGTVTITSGPHLIAESTAAIEVTESKHGTVWYLPLAAIQAALQPSDTETYCPFKGYASYRSLELPEGTIEDALWLYENPYDECLRLKNYVSFYANKVTIAATADPQRP